jgi:hypothetical protein
MEHSVYICGWNQDSEGFTLWVKSQPRIRASAPTYVEAEARLIEAIRNAGGAMQAVIEFEHPLPQSTRTLLDLRRRPLRDRRAPTERFGKRGRD